MAKFRDTMNGVSAGTYYSNPNAGSGKISTYGDYFTDLAVLEKANRGDLMAMFDMAVTSLSFNAQRSAWQWLDKCYERGYAPAQYLKGQIYCAGNFRLYAKDTTKGNWLKRESLAGSLSQ